MQGKNIGILSAGSWGTAVAVALVNNGHNVVAWTREDSVANDINVKHVNEKFLPGATLPANLKATTDIKEAVAKKDFLIIATPSLYIESVVKQILDCDEIQEGKVEIGILTKGFLPSDGTVHLLTDVLEDMLPEYYRANLVYISGPSHAEEVCAGKLTGLIVASENPLASIKFRELLKGESLLVYSSLDIRGVQVCAAAKNVIAIAFGCLDALEQMSCIFGDNAISLLLAAGLNEIQTLGVALGATHAETFTSIAGVGDLDVTCRSKYGRNRRFGQEIIQKSILENYDSIDDLISRITEIGYLPEGVVASRYIHRLSEQNGLKLPICEGIYQILNKEIKPLDLLARLRK
ncbi:MAG: NAD(P)-dependent glycerol-3-phosphate dehydrogenase [Spirochaetaceae bacterium]|nr:NAD(P)-dependent glycerol-3-phosphate dehydrogenase [Spirochaetaceae bacterium]